MAEDEEVPGPDGAPYVIRGKVVEYRCSTQWERSTLMAHGFKSDSADRMLLRSDREGARYVAHTVSQGGV